MLGLRSIQAPVPEKLPRLSVVNDSATSGALPPRIACTILSSLTPPMLLTVMFGWALWKSAMTESRTPFSRLVKPLQSLIVTGLLSSAVAAGVPPPPPPLLSPPPHAARLIVTASTATDPKSVLIDPHPL